MKRKLNQFLWLISGILLIFVGVITMLFPSDTFHVISMIIGITVLLTGIFNILVYMTAKNTVFGAGWVLIEGIIDCIVAVFLLCGNMIVAEALPFIFAMWIIFTGVARTITAFELKNAGILGWGWLVLTGILGIVFGFFCFFEPIAAQIAVSILLGVILIIEGIISLLLWWYIQKIDL